jgi:hypothetical protein
MIDDPIVGVIVDVFVDSIVEHIVELIVLQIILGDVLSFFTLPHLQKFNFVTDARVNLLAAVDPVDSTPQIVL